MPPEVRARLVGDRCRRLVRLHQTGLSKRVISPPSRPIPDTNRLTTVVEWVEVCASLVDALLQKDFHGVFSGAELRRAC